MVNDTMLALKKMTLLDADRYPEQPALLIENPPWPAHEMLPTRSALAHLSSFVAGLPNYSIPPSPAHFSSYAIPHDLDRHAATPKLRLEFLGQLWPGDEDSILALL